MSELSPEARKLLQDARDAFAPDPARTAAVREALAARIAELGSAGSAASGGALSTSAVWPKLIGIALIGAAGAGVLWASSRSDAPAPVEKPSSSMVEAPAQVAAAPSAIDEPAPAPSEAAEAPATATEPTPIERRARPERAAPSATEQLRPRALTPRPSRAANAGRKSAAITPSARPKSGTAASAASETSTPAAPAPGTEASTAETPEAAPTADAPDAQESASADAPTPDDSLQGELALLRRARAALEQRNAAEALALAKRHAELYPHGTLRQERLATQVLALCGLQRTKEARALARELERVAPRSPHLMRIRTSCVTEGGF